VVSDFQQVGAQIAAVDQKTRLAPLARVAGEQRMICASVEQPMRETQGDAILVDGVAGVGERRVRGRQHVEHDAVISRPAHPGPHDAHGDAALACRRDAIEVGATAVLLTAVGDHVDLQCAHDWRTSTNMIAVGSSLTSRGLAPPALPEPSTFSVILKI